jgi:hypothetical protein
VSNSFTQEEAPDDEEEEEEGAATDSQRRAQMVALGPTVELFEDDELDFDPQMWNEDKWDSTAELPPVREVPPEVDVELECPEESKLTPLKLHRRRIMWWSDHRKDGTEGWLKCEIAQGQPPAPQVALGATMRVKFDRRLDSLAPASLTGLKNAQALRIVQENYGRVWYLVKL